MASEGLSTWAEALKTVFWLPISKERIG
jgi:hypothetical protein